MKATLAIETKNDFLPLGRFFFFFFFVSLFLTLCLTTAITTTLWPFLCFDVTFYVPVLQKLHVCLKHMQFMKAIMVIKNEKYITILARAGICYCSFVLL